MATLNKENLRLDTPHAGEYGNVSSAVKKLASQNLAADDVLHIARIPANSELLDLTLINGAAGGTSAVKVGYVPVDSDNGAGDDEYFIASQDVSAAGRTRANAVKEPVYLPYAVDVVITATTGFTAAADLSVNVEYVWQG